MATNPASTTNIREYASPSPADAEVQRLLDDFGRAVTSGDCKAAAALWGIPGMLLGDIDVRAVSSRDDLAAYFERAREEYNAQGVTATRPEVRNLTWLTRELALVEVRWPWLNARREEKGEETSTYVLRREEGGTLKIQVAVRH
jgi:hypothetical protein